MTSQRHEVRIVRVQPDDDGGGDVTVHGVCRVCDERFEFTVPARDYFQPGRVIQLVHDTVEDDE